MHKLLFSSLLNDISGIDSFGIMWFDYPVMKRLLPIGSLAPDFTLIDDSGNVVTLREFRGKSPVLLVFYVMNATPG